MRRAVPVVIWLLVSDSLHSSDYYLTNGFKQFTVPLATVRKKSCGFRPAYVNDVIVEVPLQFWL